MQDSSSSVKADLGDLGRELMELFALELKRRMKENAASMTASELEVVRKLLGDNSVTLAAIRRGDFGKVAKAAAEDFPFPSAMDDSAPVPLN